mmetsp:Transcript_41493/g.83386  ORF Transcript_41493/g.83386 Transcript_41493/m.83386 type:complete len:363 (+) Transcript_41493:63-1151(+)
MLRRDVLVALLFGTFHYALCQETDVPYVQGTFEITYKYQEMRGDRDIPNVPPCLGPFPYSYTFKIDIFQTRGENQFSFCFEGTDCATSALSSGLKQGAPDVILADCEFKPYEGFEAFTRLPDGVSPRIEDPLRPRDQYGQEEDSYVFSQFHVPETEPYVWGTFCNQYNWQDVALSRNIDGSGSYAGTWRNENETWFFVRDITTCKCYPSCAECQERVPGTNVFQVNPGTEGVTCLARYDAIREECDWRLHGVGGGAVLYTPEMGYPLLPDGAFQRCFHYSEITGVRTRTAEELEALLVQSRRARPGPPSPENAQIHRPRQYSVGARSGKAGSHEKQQDQKQTAPEGWAHWFSWKTNSSVAAG